MVGNGQKMNCELKVSVNMRLQNGQTVKLTEVLYVPQSVKILFNVSRLVSKGATMGDTQYKMIIKKNGVIISSDLRKLQNKSIMFYLKSKIYPPEVQKALTNLTEKKKIPVTKKKNRKINWAYQVRWTSTCYISTHILEKTCCIQHITILVSS